MTIEIIQVKTRVGEMPVYLEEGPEMKKSKCRGCGADILWGITEKGKSFPISRKFNENKFEYISHFADCPKANDFRNKNDNNNRQFEVPVLE